MQAAAMPAGPAPTTVTSSWRRRLAISLDLHSFLAEGQATAGIGLAVDGDTTFKTDPHAAERAAGFVVDAGVERRHTRLGHCRRHEGAGRHGDRFAVDQNV